MDSMKRNIHCLTGLLLQISLSKNNGACGSYQPPGGDFKKIRVSYSCLPAILTPNFNSLSSGRVLS
jgi:hypothetical protein